MKYSNDGEKLMLKLRPLDRNVSCSSDKTLLFLLFDTICMYFVLMAIVTLVFYSLGLLVRVVKESQHIRSKYIICIIIYPYTLIEIQK